MSGLPNVSAHETVNHSIEFVNSTTGAHTQHVESYWNRCELKRMSATVPTWMNLCGGSDLGRQQERHLEISWLI